MDTNSKVQSLPSGDCSREDQQALLSRIGELAREYRGREGSLIQVLHMAQGIYGYLPLEVQRVIADGLELPLAEVSGVVSFYSFFSTQRRGRHTIRVCLGTACYVRGGKRIVERLRELLKVEATVMYFSGNSNFVAGGIPALKSAPMDLLLPMFVLGFLGFGVKAAIFPFHDWLPAASVAPTPVTALLHAVAVVKAGAFAVIRLSHYCFSPDLMRGTWAQTVCLIVAMFSIVFGSAMAVRERHMKRRLAYSTMSNLSYVLLGALMLTPEGLQGGLLHMVYHAIMKICLFSCVGAMMIRTGKSYVGEMRGMSRVMPFTMAVFLFCGIELVGIPPFVGFQSKWALATAALGANGALGVAAVVVLIVSAVLTSIYMLAPAVSAYAMPLSPDSGLEGKRLDPGWRMQLPLILLVIVMLILVFASAPLADYLGQVAAGLV